VEFTITRAADGDFQAWREIGQCAHASHERQEFINGLLARLLTEEFKREDVERMKIIGDAATVLRVEYLGPNGEVSAHRLPVKLATRIQDDLRPFVTERAAQSAFLAGKAWQWYGLISSNLVATHGVTTYYNSPIMGIGGVDGLTGITLCASRIYNSRYSKVHQRQTAIDALGHIAHTGFSTWPIPRALLNVDGVPNGAPLSVWRRLILDLKSHPNAMAGALFAMMLSLEVGALRGSAKEDKSRADYKARIIKQVLGTNVLQKLKLFPRIEAAIRAGKLVDKPNASRRRVTKLERQLALEPE
jgi:hypothetical protein